MMTNKVSTEIAGMEPGQVFFPHAKVVFIIQVSDVLMCFCEWASQLREWASQLRDSPTQLPVLERIHPNVASLHFSVLIPHFSLLISHFSFGSRALARV